MHHETTRHAMQLAASRNLAAQSMWQRILYFHGSWFGGVKSLVDSPDFFLSSQGKADSAAELNETILRMLQVPQDDLGPQDANASVFCRFPLRTQWIVESLPEINFPKVPCPALDSYFAAINPTKLSFLFSSYYPNNPASLFGHTFLKMDGSPGSNPSGQSALLQIGVGFAAYPDANNPLMYGWRGMSGGFPGRFDLLPYYIKIQEYNQSESRDIWEYDLNVTPQQIRNMMLSLWELRHSHIDYYYFDDNCSFVMLKLLDIAFPERDLSSSFRSWVVPSDTLRAIAAQEGLVHKVTLRPSVLRRFKTKYDNLTLIEKRDFEAMIARTKTISGLTSTPAERRHTIDSFLEFTEFDERLGGSKVSVK